MEANIIDKTIETVCRVFMVGRDELLHSRLRHRYLTDARMTLCVLLDEQGIGRRLIAHTVNRTLVNVEYSLHRLFYYAEKEPALAEKIDAARKLIIDNERLEVRG